MSSLQVQKEQGAGRYQRTHASRHNASEQGDAIMPFEANMGTNPPKSIPNWKSIGQLAREIAEKAAERE